LLFAALNKAFISLKKEHVHDVLLACTDFHGLCPNIPSIRIHDTLEILVQATINMI